MKHFPPTQALARLPLLATLVLSAASAWADFGDAAGKAAPPTARDKSGYTLFNPVPQDAMREFSTDRPDQTECPFTIDAGHVQFEMDFATFTQDRAEGLRTRTWNVAPFNVRVGLLNNLELSLIFDSYLHVRTEDRAARTAATQSGVGDFTARLKLNLWGNDGGKTAFALLPYIKFPTNSGNLGNRAVEGGLLLPLSIELPGGFGLALETGASFIRNDDSRAYHAEIVNSISIDHAIVGKLSGYVEFYSTVSTQRHQPWVGTVDVGLEFAVTENIQLDCGCNIGVSHGADDVNPFVGISVRF
ncbi:MAG TPA: transporter [Chthoniobacter sp.]|nr:transporter [Chthoniobacter sp.]